MKIEHVFNKIRYTLTNENLNVGDKVYPITRGRCLDDGGWILHNLDYRDFISGFPNEPHTLLDLNYSKSKPYQVRTDMGYSPIECYYKIIKKEQNKLVKEHIFGSSYEWTEIE